ncbi:CoA transferase subunit A [Alteromonas sp. NFXS44]|uniref:CoA transferase subunit A n=1 Tax=Alteromonas sp. NFXS44 TaxID=2818435 RepID=UPI0032DE6275
MAKFTSLKNAISDGVHDGQSVSLEGFTHLIPFAAGHEIIRQQRRQLTLIRMTPDLIYDQLVGAGCVSKLVFSWGGNPGVGSLHRVRDAIENAYPEALEIEEHSHAAMANAYEAGAAGLPMALFRGYVGSDLQKVNPNIATVTCPFSGEALAAVPAIKPDVGIIHAQKADKAGNVLLEGIVGVQKEVVLSSHHSIVTVEEIVDDLNASTNSCIIPGWAIDAICHVPLGAKPSYAQGYYPRDNSYYKKWDAISRQRDSFASWLDSDVFMQGAC